MLNKKSKIQWLFIAILFLNFLIFLPYLSYIIGGFVLAYFIYPFYSLLPKKIPRRVAAILMIAIFTILVSLGSFIVILQAYNELVKYFPKLLNSINHLQLRIEGIQLLPTNLLTSLTKMLFPTVVSFASNLATHLPDFVMGTFISFVSAYYFLIDGPQAKDYILSLISDNKKEIEGLVKTIKAYLDAVILGQLFGSAAQAIVSYFGFLVLNIPLAALLSIVVFFLAILPIVGPWLVWLGITIYMILQGKWALVAFSTIYGFFVVGLIDNVVRAFLLSSRANLHPLLALVSMLGGVTLIGFPGIFIGPVVVGLLLSFLDYYKEYGKLSIAKE